MTQTSDNIVELNEFNLSTNRIINSIIESSNRYEDLRGFLIHSWALEVNKKIRYYIDKDNNIKAFILLHLTDYDPLGYHTNPHVLDYIYTYPEYRKKGYAVGLIQYIVNEKLECTAFCDNNASVKLFEECGFDCVAGFVRVPH
jgi:GNAT superfamily N-acetyltransferase